MENEEYEIHHYGFSVAELKKETSDMIHEEVDKACVQLVESLVTSPQIGGDIAAEIDRKKNILASNVKELLIDTMNELGNIMTECFSIPPNVTLSTDQMKLKSIDANEQQLQKQLDASLKHFKALEQFNSTLSEELEMYRNMDSLIMQQHALIETTDAIAAAQPDVNHIKEQAANVNVKFNLMGKNKKN